MTDRVLRLAIAAVALNAFFNGATNLSEERVSEAALSADAGH